jgi:hypothetical protein
VADPNQTPKRNNWACPCNGCKKAAKQEQDRIIGLIESIDVGVSSSLNALGFKILALEAVKQKK